MLSVLRLALLCIVSLMGTLGIAEVLIRVVNPSPRVQAISLDPSLARPEGREITVVNGTPFWRAGNERENRDCGADDRESLHVVVLGDSIPYGSIGVEPDKTFSSFLQSKLSRPDRRVCVHNYGLPGSGFIQQAWIAEDAIARHAPEVILWTLWVSSANQYRAFGDIAYELGRMHTDSAGLPRSILPLPTHRFLFEMSALYRYAVIALGTARNLDEVWIEFAQEGFAPRLDALRKGIPNTPLIFVQCPRLDTPFEIQTEWRQTKKVNRRYSTWAHHVQAELDARGIPLVHLDENLIGHPLEEVRVDKCCHFNDRGMEIISEILLPLVAERLPERTAP